MSAENVAANQGTLGRLKPVGKVRKPFTCDDCGEDFPIGSPCYDQSDYTGKGFFPEKRRICMNCGEIQKANGIEVKPKPEKKKKSDACGENTLYPKPDKSGDFWKCGEIAPGLGPLFCCKCLVKNHGK